MKKTLTEQLYRTKKMMGLIVERKEPDPEVIKVQELLKSKGHDLGDYGPNGDGIDGIMGPMTRKAYEKEFGKPWTHPITGKEYADYEIKTTGIEPKNFHKIPLGNENFRSAEPREEDLASLIQKYNIKRIVRFNGNGSDSDGLTIERERQICEDNGCEFFKLSSTKNQDKVNSLLEMGNTLIHCHHGADRTGGNVGGWLKTKGWDTKKIWDYTTQYNGWERMIKNSPSKFVNGGYLKQAQKFGVSDLEHARSLS